MFPKPSVADLIALAKELGFHLTPEEASEYRDIVVHQLGELDEFLQSRDLLEPRPEGDFNERDRGYRPSAEEDPFNAWLWKCSVSAGEEGMLAGKRVSYKDNIAVAGIPLTFGSLAMEGFIPDLDATVVSRALGSGAIVVGKNTCDSFAEGFGFGGKSGDFWPPINPHDSRCVTGASSSGSAVAVSIGETDIAFGGDQGGSIRIPAAWCGVLGLKPSYGLISYFGAIHTHDPGFDSTGPITRTTEDAARALEAVAGFDGKDPRQGRDIPDCVSVVDQLDRGIAGLRIGVVQEGFFGASEPVSGLVSSAIDELVTLGAKVAEISIPEHTHAGKTAKALQPEATLSVLDSGVWSSITRTYFPSTLSAAVTRLCVDGADHLSPWIKTRLLTGTLSRRTYHGRVYAKAHNLRTVYTEIYDSALREVDVLLMPTCLTTAPLATTDEKFLDEEGISLKWGLRLPDVNTRPFNYTGHPALAIPCGKSDGLPVSMQLVGRRMHDGLLLRVASEYEHSVDWDRLISVEPRDACHGGHDRNIKDPGDDRE